jgi:hypothetical protein
MHDDNDDPFDGINNMNSNAYSNGFAEGTVMGERAAFVAGFKIGKETAFNIGGEVGQYTGACEAFLLNHQSPAEATTSPSKNERHIKLATQLLELIRSFDLVDCHADAFVPTLTQIRDKYKQFCSLTSSRNYVVEQDLSKTKLNF